MTRGEICRLIDLPLAWALFYSYMEEVAKRGIGKAVDEFSARMGLLAPFLRISYTVCHTFAHNALVKNTVLQFQEDAADTGLSIREVIDGKTFVADRLEEIMGQLFHPFFGCLS